MKKKKKTAKRKPVKQGISGNAKFKKGQSGNPAGRPKGIDIRQAARVSAKKAGVDLDQAVGDVILKMIEEALAGDVAAARLVMDRMCGPLEPAPVQVNIDNRPPPTEPPGETWAEHFARIVEVSRGIAPTNGRPSR